MRKFILLVLIIMFFGGLLWAEEPEAREEKLPVLTFNFLLKDAIAAPGFSMELLLGRLGIGGTFSFFFMGFSDFLSSNKDVILYIYEPGVYVHLYLFDPEASLYVLGDLSFAMLAATSEGETVFDSGDYDTGLLALNLGVGFNAFMGSKKRIHFSIELGARYNTYIIEGEEADQPIPLCSPILPHFQIQFGMGLF
jgi:hypothetical protein